MAVPLKFIKNVGEQEAENVLLGQAPKSGFILLKRLLFYAGILLEILGRGILDFSGVLTCS